MGAGHDSCDSLYDSLVTAYLEHVEETRRRGHPGLHGEAEAVCLAGAVVGVLAQDDHLHLGHLHPGGPGPDLGWAGEDGPRLSLPEHKDIQLDEICDSLYDSLEAAYLSTKSFSLRNQSFVNTSLRATNQDGPMSVERICKSLDIFVS